MPARFPDSVYSKTNPLHGQQALITFLANHDIQLLNEGRRFTLVIPTDKYYLMNTTKLNDLRFPELIQILPLLNCFPQSTFHVVGFTDSVGTKAHKKALSQQRADSMRAFLWSQGIKNTQLTATGYGDAFDVGNLNLVHSSAMNRRIEIQWQFMHLP